MSVEELAVPHQSRRRFRVNGRWYYLVLVGTAGSFAWVPFLHAAKRLKTPQARRLAVLFGALDVLMYLLLVLTPQDSHGNVTNGPISTIGGLLALGTVIGGCVMLESVRRLVYRDKPAIGLVGDQPVADPAVQAVLTGRARREEARKLAADDPLMARELHIGRPDLPTNYDDGGLVDLNSAPAATIAQVCGVSPDVATTIVLARDRRDEPFANVDELFVLADVPVSTWDRIRDRAVLLP